jgi:ribosome recycling factor
MTTAEKPQIARYKDRMDKCVVALKEEFATLRTGRASAGLLDQVMVDAYGARSPITQLAAVSVPEARMITVSVWDKAVVVSVEKAIRNSGLGLNPVVEGQNLRIPIPPLTEERRRDLAKLAGKYAEQQKVAVRNVRRDAMDDLKKAEKDGAINQDEHKRLEVEVQKVTDEAVRRVDEVLKTKEQEIMQV